MRDKNRDQVARAGAKVARAKLVLALAERELNEAMVKAMERPRLEPALQKHRQEQRLSCFLTAVGNRKIEMIKTVRAVTFLGLKEAKDIVDRAEQIPTEIKANVSREEAENIKAVIARAGGIVEFTDKSRSTEHILTGRE